MCTTFDHLLVLGRPAGGKSEFIDFMIKIDDRARAERYHIGKFEGVDDFVWLWEKFEEDDLWEKIGKPRLYSKIYEDKNYGLVQGKLLDFCIEKFNFEIPKKYLSKPEFYKDNTLLIEFSRGGANGYNYALNHLSREVLANAAIIYIFVTFEESWRRNVARYEAKLKHSILAHKVPRETLEKFYLTDDWAEVTKGNTNGYLNLYDLKVPFVTMNNEQESVDPIVLDERYGKALNKLMELFQNR